MGCGLPILIPYICLKGRESQPSRQGNPESDQERHALGAFPFQCLNDGKCAKRTAHQAKTLGRPGLGKHFEAAVIQVGGKFREHGIETRREVVRAISKHAIAS